MRSFRRYQNAMIATVLACCWTAVFAQDSAIGADNDDTDRPRRYTVEVIIFKYTENVAIGSERFFPDDTADSGTPAVEDDLLEELQVTPFERQIDLGPYFGQPPKFVLLGDDDFTMTRILDQFELLDVYETIMHFGWTQLTYPDELAKPIELRVFGDPPPGLEGNFTLYLTRYLHLVVDLSLAAQEDGEDGLSGDAYGYGVSRFGFGAARFDRPPPVYYRISENRIVRSGDVRYFDHPKFGVIAKVTRVEEEPEPAGQPDPLLGVPGE